MEMKRFGRRIFSVAFALGLAIGAGACDDNPVGPDARPEPAGVVITDLTGNVLTQTQGEQPNATFDRPLQVAVGEDLEARIFFVDPSGERFRPDPSFGESLRVVTLIPAIAEWSADGDHGTFVGRSTGSTQALVQLMRGTSAVETFAGPTIEVVASR